MNKNDIDQTIDFVRSFSPVSGRPSYSRTKIVISGGVKEVYDYGKDLKFGKSGQKRFVLRRGDRIRKRTAFSLSRSRLRIRRLIEANRGYWGCMPVFVTFTFAENLVVLSEANLLWKKFVMRLRYELKFSPKYISIVEFQKRGAIHYHAIFFNLPFINDIKTRFSKTWGHGFINIKAVTHVNSLGGYISKYLQKDIADIRLFNEKCFFVSRGLQKPFVTRYPPVPVDFLDLPPVEYVLEDIREYNSKWTGRTIYKRYRQK